MSTQQKYGPDESGATSFEPTGKKPVQAVKNLLEQLRGLQADYLLEIGATDFKLDSLFELLVSVQNLAEGPDSSLFIHELFHEWAAFRSGNLNKQRYEISSLFGLLAHLNQLRSNFGVFENNAGFTAARNTWFELENQYNREQ